MSSPALFKTALTLPAIPLLLGAEMAKGEEAETLGGRIARLRREKGLTQIELAELLRVSQPVISDYENDVMGQHLKCSESEKSQEENTLSNGSPNIHWQTSGSLSPDS